MIKCNLTTHALHFKNNQIQEHAASSTDDNRNCFQETLKSDEHGRDTIVLYLVVEW